MNKNIDGESDGSFRECSCQDVTMDRLLKILCILLPVHGVLDKVKYNIEHILSACNTHFIDIYICDSSPDNAIYEFVHNIKAKNIFYLDERQRPTTKLFRAYEELRVQYRYVWLIGDGIVYDVKKVYKHILKYIYLKYDIVHLIQNNKISSYDAIETTYTNAMDFYIDNVWSMTLYGSHILSSKILSKINWSEMVKRYSSGFVVVMSIYTICAECNFKAVRIRAPR